ncbi:MAG TPA: hypothetical protein VHL78_11990 [Actinomycetota bacterium]|nr:hypothetical protein [Actinomycetota bacterium]
MPKTPLAVALAVVAFTAACAGLGPDAAPPKNVLFLRTADGVALVTASPRAAAVNLPGAVPATDWSAVVRAVRVAGGTEVVAHDSTSGDALWSRTLEGRLEVKVASPDGRFVALGTPGPGGYSAGRSSTDLVVLGDPGSPPRTIRLRGNFQPEAFSTDGASLFVVEYLPARNPDSYRVRRLDLATGRVVGVFTPDAELQQAMGGTARVQAASPDGRRLYTLYSLDGPDGSTRSFIHVLSLDELWAHCIDLPAPFAGAFEEEVALSVSPDGRRLHAVDTSSATLAEVDTRALSVTRTVGVDLDAAAGPPHAAGPARGRLYLASGPRLLAVDAATLAARRSWDLDEDIRGLQAAADGSRLFIGLEDRIVVLDTVAGRLTRTLRPADVGVIDQLGRSTRSLDAPRTEFTCAC